MSCHADALVIGITASILAVVELADSPAAIGSSSALARALRLAGGLVITIGSRGGVI
ncbi:hypothetical protein KAI87_12120 [Myxococcota bacterium]|nr:hypothetical protein [Myxococcota bacterium]